MLYKGNTRYPIIIQTDHTVAFGLTSLVSPQKLNSFEALTLDSDWALPCLPLGKDPELGSFCPYIKVSEKALDWSDSKLYQYNGIKK